MPVPQLPLPLHLSAVYAWAARCRGCGVGAAEERGAGVAEGGSERWWRGVGVEVGVGDAFAEGGGVAGHCYSVGVGVSRGGSRKVVVS